MTMASGIAKKNGGAPEGARQGKTHVLNITESPPKGNLFARQPNGKFVTASPDKRAADWLESQIANSQDGIISMVVDLTPALARALLNRNAGNRKISDICVTAYARDIAAGAWTLNGEPVIVSRDGKMNDGQHRCEAVVAADKTIPVLMVFGIDRDTRTTVDQGRARTAGDFLSMRGFGNVNQLGAAASFAWRYVSHNRLADGSRLRPTKSEVLAFVADNPELVASLEFVQRKGAVMTGGYSLLGFIHWALWKAGGRLEADLFIHTLIDGTNLGAGDPLLYVRNRLINERGRMRANDKAELIFKAWNGWRTGKKVQRFEVTGGALPTLEA